MMRLLLLILAGCGSSISPASETQIHSIEEDTDTELLDTDVPEDTEEPEDTATEEPTEVMPTGLLGGVVQLRGLEVGCPQCFGLDSTLDTYAGVQFHPPLADDDWTSKLPSPGHCADSIGPDPIIQTENRGARVYLNGPTSITLPHLIEDGQDKYRKTGFGEAHFEASSDYDLLDESGGLIASAAVHTPAELDWISHSLILADFGSGAAYSQPIRRNLTNEFTWAPTGDDLFVIGVEVYDSTGNVYKGGTVCVDFDDGQFLIPIGPLQEFDFGDLAAVYMYRWHRTSSMDEVTGHTLEGVGITGVLGTAILID